MKCRTPIIKIGDEVKIVYRKDIKFYKLKDIATWQVSKRIKTIFFEEREDPYNYETHKYIKRKHKPKYKIVNRDQIMIKSKTESRAYQVIVYSKYKDESKIGHVHFNKLMNSFCRCN